MILLGLASVGLIAVNKVVNEQSLAANARRGSVAYHVTESGAYTAIAYADSLGAFGLTSMLTLVVAETPLGEQPLIEPDELAGFPFFDMSATGSFGFEGASQQGFADADAALSPPMDFRVNIETTGMIQPLEGYALNGAGSRCRFRHKIDTDGNLGLSRTDSGFETFRAWKRIRSLVNVGPLPCRKSGGTI